MNAFGFAWRSLVRQPARACLGILGVAAVGALLFDMLLLSQGLLVSMRTMLDRAGWDVRVTNSDELPGNGPRIPDATRAEADISTLPSVRAITAIRFADGEVDVTGRSRFVTFLNGVSNLEQVPWTLLRGAEPASADQIVVNEVFAATAGLDSGATMTLRPSCRRREAEALPPVPFTVSGVATFPFEEPGQPVAAGTMAALARACGGGVDDEANLLLVASAGDPAATAADIRRVRPDLTAVTNEEMIGRLQATGFTYFRQISTVLTTVTLSFAVLLISVLLTVSINQRLGEIAALRALGFSRRRVVADVLAESTLIVGIGGLLSLPLGLALANGLDRILKGMPGIPESLHFFVFQPSALTIHVSLLAATAVVAALYPVRIVSRLPIAATLRDEVVG